MEAAISSTVQWMFSTFLSLASHFPSRLPCCCTAYVVIIGTTIRMGAVFADGIEWGGRL